MQARFTRQLATLTALAAAFAIAAASAPPAQAGKTKSIKTEAKFVSYHAETETITVKVMRPGKRPADRALALKTGKEATFKVKPEGSILTRTSVTLNGKRADITDISENQTLNIYWVPHTELAGTRFARKIDMILSDAELEARDNARLEQAKQKGQVAD